jgi:hypothetical protein
MAITRSGLCSPFSSPPTSPSPRTWRVRASAPSGYNLAHTYVLPIALAAGCLLSGEAGLPVQIALIWSTHIGIDRLFGYGLKYPSAFKDTHLGRV